MLKKYLPWLIILFAAALSLFSVYWYQVHWLYHVGLPLDDSYIHLQYARNILKGEWFVYIRGQKPTPGDTSPLWVLMIAALGVVHKNLMMNSLSLSGLFYILSGFWAYMLGKKFFGQEWLATVYALLVIFTGRILWSAASGMEVTLFSFLSMLGLWLYLRGKEQGRFSIFSALIFGLALNARPEGGLLFALVLADWILLEKIYREKKLRLSSIPWAALIIFVLLASPSSLFSFATTGHLTPDTYRATKLPVSWPRSENYFKLVIQFFYHDHLLLHLGLPVGVLAFLGRAFSADERERKGILLWAWPLGYLAISTIFTPIVYHFQRYLIPTLPLFILVSLNGWLWLIEKAEKWLHSKSLTGLRLGLCVALVGWAAVFTLYNWTRMTALCVKNIDDMQVKIGYWVRDHTGPQDVIAANDIGAIFYLSQRPLLDLVGLVNPELLARVQGVKIPSTKRDEITLAYLKETRPAYLIAFPNWFPTMVEKEQYFQKVYSVTLDDNIICAGDEMVVYKCRWP